MYLCGFLFNPKCIMNSNSSCLICHVRQLGSKCDKCSLGVNKVLISQNLYVYEGYMHARVDCIILNTLCIFFLSMNWFCCSDIQQGCHGYSTSEHYIYIILT